MNFKFDFIIKKGKMKISPCPLKTYKNYPKKLEIINILYFGLKTYLSQALFAE